jgi:hypothetical protein
MTKQRRPTNQPPRSLEDIGADLSNAIQNRTAGTLRMGRLLNEAQDAAAHGEWLPFLKRHRIEERSARRRMKMAKWADERLAKSDNLSDFELGMITAQAMLELASNKYGDDVVERVMSAARYRHIGIADIKAIAKFGDEAPILREIKAQLKAQAEAEKAKALAAAKAAGFDTVEAHEAALDKEYEARQEAFRQAAEAKDAEADRLLDAGSEVPPTPEPVPASSKSFHVSTFEKSVHRLKTIMTKPLASFAAADVSPDDIDQVAHFLMDVVSQRKKTAA